MTNESELPVMQKASHVREVDARGVAWTMRRKTAEAVKRGGALDYWERAQARSARSLDASPGRVAFRTDIAGPAGENLPLEITVFLRPRARDIARSILAGSRAERMWRAAMALEEAGVPTLRLLAAGSRKAAGFLREDALIAEALDAAPLDEYLESQPAADCARLLRVVAPVLARVLRLAHATGVRIRGLSANDVLVAEAPDGVRRLVLGGLEKMRPGTVVSLGARLDDVASLGASLANASRTDRRRFFAAYVDGVHAIERHSREYARLLESHVEVLRRRGWARIERESLGTNADFRRVRAGRFRGHTVRGAIELEREDFARVPPSGMPMPQAVIIKDAPEGRVYEQEVYLGVGSVMIVVKQKRRIGPAGVLKTFGRRVGATRAWRTLWAMKARGLPVEEPLAAFERRKLGFTFESTLITRKVEGAVNLLEFVASRAKGDFPPRLRHGLARAVGTLVARMHSAGFTQRDLKAPNVLVRLGEAGRPELTLIDVDGVCRHREAPADLCARDLGRLAADFARMPGIHATDFARTLAAYLARRPTEPGGKREFIALIKDRAGEILRRHDAKTE